MAGEGGERGGRLYFTSKCQSFVSILVKFERTQELQPMHHFFRHKVAGNWDILSKSSVRLYYPFLRLLICLLWFHCCNKSNQEEAINDFLFSCAIMDYMRNIFVMSHWWLWRKAFFKPNFKYFINWKKEKIVFYWQVTCLCRLIILTTK